MSKAKRIGVLRRELLEIEQKRDIIPDVLPVGPGFWFGASTVGKTGLLVRTVVAISAGLEWAGRETVKGAVLYVAGERPKSVAKRLCAAAEQLGLATDVLPIALMPCPAGGIIDGNTKLAVQSEAKVLARDTGVPVSLIVFDTLAQCFGDGNPDDTAAASKAVRNMIALSEDLDCAVLTVHHPDKQNRGMRGSGSYFNDVDSVCEITRKGTTSVLTVKKNKDGLEGARFAFTITGVDLETAGGVTSVQVVKDLREWSKVEKATKEENQAKRDMTDKAVALSLLADLTKDGPISLTAWQTACYSLWDTKPSQAARKQAFSNAQKKLVHDGLISIEGETVSVSVSKKLLTHDAYAHSPETVSVSVSTSPSMRGVHLRTDSRDDHLLQEPDGSVLSEDNSNSENAVGRSNDLPPGCGTGSPAECRTAAADADADRREIDAAA